MTMVVVLQEGRCGECGRFYRSSDPDETLCVPCRSVHATMALRECAEL